MISRWHAEQRSIIYTCILSWKKKNILDKKTLKIPKRYRKSKKDRHYNDKKTNGKKKKERKKMIYKTLSRKLKIEQHNPSKNRGRTPMLQKGKQFLLH